MRASVIRLWSRKHERAGADDLQDMIRFNEAIDQAIAESISTYTRDVGLSRDRFLAILGHNLRTPIGVMVTSTRFILDTGHVSEEHRGLMTLMETTARRMNRLVDDLLDFTRTRFGDTIPIDSNEMDAAQVIDDVAAEVRAAYPNSVIDIRSSGDTRGCWDGARLRQAITNLVSNAVHHGTQGAPIQVVADGSGADVMISVRNQGVPMTPDDIERMLTGVQQLGAPRHGDRRHLGLGLFIVNKIVRAHGGSMTIDSSAEMGTAFTVRLPRTTP
jgi:signal transduction histidine kinase